MNVTKISCWSLLIVLLLGINCVSAAEVTVAWDANTPSPEGYRVFVRIGASSYDYTSPVWEGPDTSTTLVVPDNTLFHVVCRAYAGMYESADSNEISYAIVVAPINLRLQ
jgi:hypothetical protein